MSHQAGSQEDYSALLRSLLPVGKAWPEDAAAKLHGWLSGLADEFARVHASLFDLATEEADPRTTTDLLVEWERALGFPDPCLGVPDTIQERRNYIHQRYIDAGSPRAVDLVAAALAYGFVVTIDDEGPDFEPFRMGESFFGDAGSLGVGYLQDTGWGFVFRVNAPAVTSTFFRMGESTMGEPLLTFGNEALECLINRIKPSHTIAQFVYA